MQFKKTFIRNSDAEKNMQCSSLQFMMQSAMKKAEKRLRLEIVILHVYSPNKPAQNLYKKLGFRVAGSVPRGIKHHGKYLNDVIMWKKLK